MPNADYYTTLSISPEASPEEIKKAYRKLALETHPDRNPGDPDAEERFKKINEAYGVLSDPDKRAQYDQYRRVGGPQRPQGQGFGYSQDEIFRDFFTSRHAQDVFSEMQREFERMGVRFDSGFINNMFFGGRNIFFQGMIFGSPTRIRVVRYGAPYQARRPGMGRGGESAPDFPKPPGVLSLLAKAGKKAGQYLLKKVLGVDELPFNGQHTGRLGPSDLTYHIRISEGQAREGAIVEIALPHLDSRRKFTVRIPAGVKTGTRLRLREMGHVMHARPMRRGDVYLELQVA
jgi:curved DNA-binding protein